MRLCAVADYLSKAWCGDTSEGYPKSRVSHSLLAGEPLSKQAFSSSRSSSSLTPSCVAHLVSCRHVSGSSETPAERRSASYRCSCSLGISTPGPGPNTSDEFQRKSHATDRNSSPLALAYATRSSISAASPPPGPSVCARDGSIMIAIMELTRLVVFGTSLLAIVDAPIRLAPSSSQKNDRPQPLSAPCTKPTLRRSITS